jgi:hypothetical protein
VPVETDSEVPVQYPWPEDKDFEITEGIQSYLEQVQLSSGTPKTDRIVSGENHKALLDRNSKLSTIDDHGRC